jgi:hypothetical protein
VTRATSRCDAPARGSGKSARLRSCESAACQNLRACLLKEEPN